MFKCEFWNPQEGKARSCDLGTDDECPYPTGGCYEDDDDLYDPINAMESPENVEVLISW